MATGNIPSVYGNVSKIICGCIAANVSEGDGMLHFICFTGGLPSGFWGSRFSDRPGGADPEIDAHLGLSDPGEVSAAPRSEEGWHGQHFKSIWWNLRI